MITQLQSIIGFREQVIDIPKEQVAPPVAEVGDVLDVTDASKVKIEDLGLSTRTENALVGAAAMVGG